MLVDGCYDGIVGAMEVPIEDWLLSKNKNADRHDPLEGNFQTARFGSYVLTSIVGVLIVPMIVPIYPFVSCGISVTHHKGKE